MKTPSRNRVELIGRVYKTPKTLEAGGRSFVRVLLEIDEESDDGKFFSSYHPVVIPEGKVGPDGIGRGDIVMVEGRSNPYIFDEEEKVGRRGWNVQASSVLVLKKNKDQLPAVEKISSIRPVKPEESFVSSDPNVVSLFGNQIVDDEPPF